ncbi:MAG TPA: hypothetical protein VNO70_16090, partial [Blastocatellia bacterium]|nr:hypothetical protein [Blastocatellia bacterium]
AGLPVPDGLDGRVIEEICAEDFLSQNPLRYSSSADNQATAPDELSQSDEELIEEKLRSLGYL